MINTLLSSGRGIFPLESGCYLFCKALLGSTKIPNQQGPFDWDGLRNTRTVAVDAQVGQYLTLGVAFDSVPFFHPPRHHAVRKHRLGISAHPS